MTDNYVCASVSSLSSSSFVCARDDSAFSRQSCVQVHFDSLLIATPRNSSCLLPFESFLRSTEHTFSTGQTTWRLKCLVFSSGTEKASWKMQIKFVIVITFTLQRFAWRQAWRCNALTLKYRLRILRRFRLRIGILRFKFRQNDIRIAKK